ncbi:hypothetical protein G134_1588 [Lactobacillus delbrueckii subsp. lactis CRL581]|nr:hypothetical protein G134_1588 [Lactobacillus delbrueckii subsp. lactis CRL581]
MVTRKLAAKAMAGLDFRTFLTRFTLSSPSIWIQVKIIPS